jgi:hypothetical protein
MTVVRPLRLRGLAHTGLGLSVLTLSALVLSAPATAEDPGLASRAFVPKPVAKHAVVELRVGVDAASADMDDAPTRPVICGEVTPWGRVGFEGCGTGAGVLHQDNAPDMAHFRVRVAVLQRSRGRVEGALIAGAGWAEVQRTADEAGFKFGEAEADQVEASGGELSISAKGHLWMQEQTYLSIDANVGAALIPGAPTAVGSDPLIGFGLISAGLGF